MIATRNNPSRVASPVFHRRIPVYLFLFFVSLSALFVLTGCSGEQDSEIALPGFGDNEMTQPEALAARKALTEFPWSTKGR